MHPLEFKIETKYGKQIVNGLLASEAKKGRIKEVIVFVESYLDDYYSKNYRSSEFKFPRNFTYEHTDD